jgi:hypothetical protein
MLSAGRDKSGMGALAATHDATIDDVNRVAVG